MTRDSLAIVLGALVAGLALGRCHAARDTEAAAHLARAQANEAAALAAYRASRDSIRAAEADRHAARAETVSLRDKLARVTQSAAQTTADSRALLADTVEATALVYRAHLVAQVAATDSLTVALQSYLAAQVVADAATERLIASQRAAIRHADSLLVAKDRIIGALRDAGRCRVLGLPCPSRRTAFMAGAVVTLGAVMAVAR